ncbi:hypothetical protein G7Y89_g1989 [Cudoniella acicularis]|uniref:Uncharacterized protein n=1 Tax=Cudoniella acicularis TaxID=354080 RepID=A0A8H4RVA6_9HELO|nr:hypothetical protein G7Y89_g1989 [Cudoniella acicularis]
MHLATTTVALLSTLSLASARIYGLQAPNQVVPGQPFTVTLLTQNYIQSVYDVAAAFGIAPGTGYPQSLGQVLSSEYLGPEKSNVVGNLNFTVIVDDNFEKGEATLSTSVMSLYGAVYGSTLSNWNVTVTVGDAQGTGLNPFDLGAVARSC